MGFRERDRLFGAGQCAAAFDGNSFCFARHPPSLLEFGVRALAFSANRGELADARAMFFFGARQFARLGFNCREIRRSVTVFGAAAADHSAGPYEVAVVRYKNGPVTIEIRRR